MLLAAGGEGTVEEPVDEADDAEPDTCTPRIKLSYPVKIVPMVVFSQQVPEPAPPMPGVPVYAQAVHPVSLAVSQAVMHSKYESTTATGVYEPWVLSEAQWMRYATPFESTMVWSSVAGHKSVVEVGTADAAETPMLCVTDGRVVPVTCAAVTLQAIQVQAEETASTLPWQFPRYVGIAAAAVVGVPSSHVGQKARAWAL